MVAWQSAMRVADRIAEYVRSRDRWLNIKPFDGELEKEYRQKQLTASIPPIIAMAFVAGLAFLGLFATQLAENNAEHPINVHYAAYRVFAASILFSAAVTLMLSDEASITAKRVVIALLVFLALLYPTALLFIPNDQNSNSGLGLAGTIYIGAFCFRLSNARFIVFLLTIGIGHFISYFFLRGLLAPINNFGAPFDLTARIPISFVPQVQVLQALIFAYLIYLLMESRERRLFLRERKLELSNQSRLHLLQAVGHDLRQPMTSILLQQGIAKEAAKLNNKPQLFHSLELIESSMQAISGELGQLTEIAAIQSNEYVPEIRSEKIADVMNDLSQAFTAEARSKQIEFSVSVQPSLQFASIDTDRKIIGRILNNLVSNAIKYSRVASGSTPTIDVVVSKIAGNDIEILIRDNGIGIAESNIEKIWQPFFQVQNKERDHLKGYGLGLTQVKVALEKLKGHRVSCNSRLSEGSEFIVVVHGSDAA